MIIYKFFISLIYFSLYPLLRLTLRKHDFKQRTSFRNIHIDECIWIHTASLGEVNAVKPLIKKLLDTYPKKTFLLTCMTKTGLSIAKEISGKLYVHQFPLDIPHIMRKAFNVFMPTLIILVETEIWPCMLSQAHRKKVPVIMVNARLSQKSYKRYKKLRWLLRKEFSTIKEICAQSEKDAEKYKQLKFPSVINANNLKFSIDLPEYETHVLRHAWKYQFNDFIIAFGSSRPGEEMLVKDLYYRLKPVIPKLKIIITPRHLQRMTEIESFFDENEYTLFSESNPLKPFLIVDEIGILPQIYALCDIAIIGGSFFDFGGHNPLEAIWYEKAVIIGKFHQSCADTVEKFLSEKAIIVSYQEELFNDICTLYQNNEQRIQMGKKAKSILLENKHSLSIHWNEIVKWI
ncbi:MAG: 3-deoxy-D-manno-octulosonic acid transferase [Candidatus Cloacimonetes bacterium]|nr:3-deoxy-D-manno-octulosonic acid transferase [Candidatus Cloacimonadota bacterium]